MLSNGPKSFLALLNEPWSAKASQLASSGLSGPFQSEPHMKGHSLEKKSRLNKDGSICKKGTGQKTCMCGQKAPVRKKHCSACGKDTVWLLKRDTRKKRKKTGQSTKGGSQKKKLKIVDSDPFLVDGVSSVHSQVTETCSLKSYSADNAIGELKDKLKAKERALAKQEARFKKKKKVFITKANELKRRRKFAKNLKKLVIAEKKAMLKREAKLKAKEDQLAIREAQIKAKEEEMAKKSEELKVKQKCDCPEPIDYVFHSMENEFDYMQDNLFDTDFEDFLLSNDF